MTTLQEALASGRGVERAFHCHAHDNTNTPAASVNVALGVWVCYSCGAAGKTDGKISKAAKVRELAEAMVQTDTHYTYPETWLEIFDAHHPSPYWVDRVGYETAELYRCGTDPVSCRPTYPIRDIRNRILGVVERTGGTPKYLYPANVSVSACLFGYEYAAASEKIKPLVLVEGASDVLALHAKSQIFAVGLFGAGIKPLQVDPVKRLCRRVVVACDNDEAGKRATTATVNVLRSNGVKAEAFVWPDHAKDFADLDAAEIDERINGHIRKSAGKVE